MVAVDMFMVRCNSTRVANRFHQSAFSILQELQGDFLDNTPYPHPKHPDVYSELEANGELWGYVLFNHALLHPSNPTWQDERRFSGRYIDPGVSDRTFAVRQEAPILEDALHYVSAQNDCANGRLAFLKLIVPHFDPTLAMVDEIWDTGIQERHLDKGELRRLFWSTYFGPQYVEKLGRDFLLATPAWRVEALANGVLITVTEKFLDFARNKPTAVLNHLRKKLKDIRPNRYKVDPNF